MARDNNNTRIYIDPSGTGVEIADLQKVLRRGTSDAGLLCGDVEWDKTQTPAVLVDSKKINKWAKHKPFRHSVQGYALDKTQSTPALRSPNRVNAARTAHYGLSVESFNALGDPDSSISFLYKLMHGQLKWTYLKPRGLNGGGQGVNEWFSLPDFDGYYSGAVCPVGEPLHTAVIQSGTATIAWDLVDLDGDNISLADIYIGDTPLTSYYFGVFLMRGTTYYAVTSDTAIGSNDVQISISNASSLEGTWQAYPFFSSVQIPLGAPSQASSGSYVSAGWDEPSTEITFRSSASYIYVFADGTWRDTTHSIVDVSYFVQNGTGTAQNVTMGLYIYKTTPGQAPTSGSMIAQDSISLSIPLGTSADPYTVEGTKSISIDPSQYDSSYDWWIIASIVGRTPSEQQIQDPEE